MPEFFQFKDKNQEKLEKYIDRCFKQGELLYEDVINVWGHLAYPNIDRVDGIKTLPHYEQHYIEKGAQQIELIREAYGEKEAVEHEQYYPVEVKHIMELSNPEQIRRFDSLVDEFNEDLERIKAEKDLKKIKEFYKRAEEIIRAKK